MLGSTQQRSSTTTPSFLRYQHSLAALLPKTKQRVTTTSISVSCSEPQEIRSQKDAISAKGEVGGCSAPVTTFSNTWPLRPSRACVPPLSYYKHIQVKRVACSVLMMQVGTLMHCLHCAILSSIDCLWPASGNHRTEVCLTRMILYHFEITLTQLCKNPLPKVPERDGCSLQS